MVKVTRRQFLKGVAATAGVAAVTIPTVATINSQSQLGSVSSLLSQWKTISLTLNGQPVDLKVKANWTLATVLRDGLGMTGTKVGCNNSSCGACTVLLDGNPVYSCHRLAIELDGHEVTTIEGIGDPTNLHPVQQAFMTYGAPQCGYCIPGFIMSTVALQKSNPSATLDQIRTALSGNICRCCSYPKIMQAVQAALGSQV